jgi:23S rRNA (guanosine2251-2'-O)-methyltransferase
VNGVHRGQEKRDPGRFVTGRRAVAEAIRSGEAVEVRVATMSRSSPGLRALLELAEGAGIPVSTVDRRELDSSARGHQGVIARVRSRGRAELSERDLASWPFTSTALVVVLDGITDPQNLGAAARSAEAAGAEVLVSRVRRAAPVTSAAIGASAGALLHLPHARVANIPRALDRLRDADFVVAGLDDSAETTVYDEPCPATRVALVVGSEGEGISRLARERCDLLLSLPMRGRVGSLNASAALAAALYAWFLPPRPPGARDARRSGA